MPYLQGSHFLAFRADAIGEGQRFFQRYMEEASHIAWFDLLGRAERIAR